MLPKLDLTAQQQGGPARLILKFQDQEIELTTDGGRQLSLGRADENDVTIKGNLISRIHARIEPRKNRFVLIDESTNGTFVQRDDGEEVYVRRDSAQLTGSGLIGLGKVAARGTPLVIEYSLSNDTC